jgi:hypothetical protein
MMLSHRKFRLPKDIPIEEYPKPETYLEEARRLTDEAQKQGLILRVMGPIALHFYFPDYVDLYRRMERLGDRVFTDIDYASYGKSRSKLVPFFDHQGYELEKRAAMLSGGERHIFFGERIPMIDVFYDKLNYNHPIDYKGRLEIHPHCVSLTDLLLQKIQIVQINDKDLKDAILLLLAAQVGEKEDGMINLRYISGLMSDDWGFYYTSTTNLAKVKQAMQSVQVLSDQHRATIGEKADRILQIIENEPKSGRWKRRANVGAKKPWFNAVSDWE